MYILYISLRFEIIEKANSYFRFTRKNNFLLFIDRRAVADFLPSIVPVEWPDTKFIPIVSLYNQIPLKVFNNSLCEQSSPPKVPDNWISSSNPE